MTGELSMQRAFGDLALFFRHIKGKLMGVAGTYVDDTFLTGSQEFKDRNAQTVERFESRAARDARLTFSGIDITRGPVTVLVQHKNRQCTCAFSC